MVVVGVVEDVVAGAEGVAEMEIGVGGVGGDVVAGDEADVEGGGTGILGREKMGRIARSQKAVKRRLRGE